MSYFLVYPEHCLGITSLQKASIVNVKGNFLDFRCFSLGHGQFYCKGSMDLVLEGRDEGHLLSVGNWFLKRPTCWPAWGWAAVSSSDKGSPSSLPSPLIPCSEIICVQGPRKNRKSKNLNSFDMDTAIPPFFFVVRSFVLTLFIFKAPNYVLARTLTERVV